ncbi:hypothetical protein [Aeromonas veronii]|uniref:hypothetical protein n=1 Tax=Aeromonas veronii TaxID=654 RepID=UPI003D23194F
MDISYEQLEYIINLATDKDWVDISIAICNIAAPLFVGLFSYYAFIQSPRQLARSKIKEKEVEMLYKAFDHFFIFSDTIGLFVSNKERKYKKLLTQQVIEDSFLEKEKSSSEAVYSAFQSGHLASHILRAIGDKNTEAQIDIYMTKVVEFRSYLFELENSLLNKETKVDYKIIHCEISKRRAELDTIKDCCFDMISNFKENLKRN